MPRKVVKRAYKYRFYPTPEQAETLSRTFGCVRLVYNKALEERTRAWATEHRNISYAQTSQLLTAWKKTEDLTFLNEVSSVPLQQTLRHLQNAFAKFWNKQNRYPRFKSKHQHRDSAEYTASAFRWDGASLRLAKMTEPLNIVWSRPLPDGAKPTTVTVSRDPANRWHVSILVETTIHPTPAPQTPSVGVDVGLSHLAVLSTGEKINNPRYRARDEAKLARAQRSLARKTKGSNNRAKVARKVARIHARIADRRRDALHKLSTRLIRENQTVVVEDLNITGLTTAGGAHKRGMNRAIRDAAWGEFRSMLAYKADWYDRELVVIDRWFPSSQLCSACGVVTGKKPLNVRSWVCPWCGAAHDRDVNAAKNVEAAGLAVSVCGDGRSRVHASA